MKKTISLILAMLMVLALFAGCGAKDDATTTTDGGSNTASQAAQVMENIKDNQGAAATPPPEDDNVKYRESLTFVMDDKVAKINPFNPGGGTQTGTIYHMIYDTLIDYTLEGTYEPCLATEWTVNNDEYTDFTFKLREGVVFHNGEPFTADDVVFTWENGLAGIGSGVYNVAIKFESVEAVNDHEVRITLKESDYDFWYTIANIGAFVIMNREAVEADPEDGPMIGTGPYYVAEFVSSDYIVYERNDNYFGELPYTKTFTSKYIAEETARYILFDNDEADFILVSSVNIPKYLNDPDHYSMVSFAANNCGYLAMNCSKAPLDDVNLRMAIAYAVSDEEIKDLAFAGYSTVHDSATIWGLTTPCKNTKLEKRTQDVEKAKEYLAKSNYKGETLVIAAGMPHTTKIGTVAMAELQAIGINCELYQTDQTTLGSTSNWMDNPYDIVVNSALATPAPGCMYYYITPGLNNKAEWENEEVQDLVALTKTLPDCDERTQAFERIQEIMYEEVPYISTVHNAMFYAVHKGTGGMKCHSNCFIDFSMCYRIDE